MLMRDHSKDYTTPVRFRDLNEVFDCFTGPSRGAATVNLRHTPLRSTRHAVITPNAASSAKIRDAFRRLRHASYEESPENVEHEARTAFLDAAPEVVSALMLAKSADATVIEVRNLAPGEQGAMPPSDGIVDEMSVQEHVNRMVGAFSAGCGLGGFAYASENGGRLLRAVCPVPERAAEASSQGFADDLGWHQDNANRPMPGERGTIDPRGPMNDYQAFVCINSDRDVPMGVVALGDIVEAAASRFGSILVDRLMSPEFAINRPDSHGGGRDVEGVPLLMHDADGVLHGRFHAGNVVGMTAEAQGAYDAFRDVAARTSASVEIPGERGALLIYANTRVMHRRRRFEPRFDGTDRYYLRLYMMCADALATSNAARRGRVFER